MIMNKAVLRAWLVCLMAPWSLVACNGGEDFSDADIGGPVVQPEPGGGGPLDENIERLTIEFLDDRVENLGYDCFGDPDQGGGYIGRREDSSGNQTDQNEDETGELPLIATCGPDASSVEFFIGTLENPNNRLVLGTYYLPQLVQQPRYQITPADIVQSPARILADNTSGVANRQALYVSALLQALDNEPDESIIQVPQAAHDTVAACCPEGHDSQPTPSTLWDYDNYNSGGDEFVAAWQAWMDEVVDRNSSNPDAPGAVKGFSDSSVDEKSDVQARLNKTLDRLRAGTYQLVSAPYTREFIKTGEGSAFVPPMVLQLPFLVYPDGRVQGIGYAADVSNNDNQAEIESDTLVALEGSARMDRQLRFKGGDGNCGSGSECWPMRNVFDTSSDPDVEMDLYGRILGISLYYGIDGPPSSSPDSSDYDPDFPQNGVYELDPATDGGRYDGEAFGQSFDDELLQGSVQGIVAVNVDEDHYGTTNGLSFYRLTPKKACNDSSASTSQGGCTDIPENELDGVNYPSELDSDGTGDEDEGIPVEQEQDKPSTAPSGSPGDLQGFSLEIRDDGYIVTDLDEDCEPTTFDSGTGEYYEQGGNPADDREYRVGFVTRTNGDMSTGSVNITVHMTGPAALKDTLPHYGLRTTGRISLAGSSDREDKGLYRTGDLNYEAGIRALWLDQAAGSGYAYKEYEREVGGDLSVSQKRERLSRIRGALEGQAANCN
jgi:hypothetical protein